jgi:glycosyltransferase A (GT-A) superfamily protein (DUF2064 family)
VHSTCSTRATRWRTSGGVVLGPADDGGYYLIGMTKWMAACSSGIEWGNRQRPRRHAARGRALSIDARLIASTYDIDTIEDLRRLERDLAIAESAVAPHVRRWFSDTTP